MGLRLLGPLELVVGDRSFKVGGPRERTLLAVLALKANRVTSVDHLVDAVWGDDPPSSARAQIQVCVSGLRKLFREAGQVGAIKNRPPGYLLEIPLGELDSEEFTGLVATAQTDAEAGLFAEAATTLRRALALWRGAAFDDVRSEVVRRGAVLLANARLGAVEECMRLELQLGYHEQLCGELRAQVEQHPLSERLYQLLMLALYRTGRQVDALEVARTARATLIDQVGVEPGRELAELEAAILNRDPALEVAPAGSPTLVTIPPAAHPVTPRQLPGSTADFVGRETHIAEIRRLLSLEHGAETPYAIRVVAIVGRGGVGKSTLALRVAHELGDAFTDGHLYADLHGIGGLDSAARVLVRFLRALGVSGAAMPEDVLELAELYRSMVAGKRLLVVLDDVTSEEQVLPLLPGTPTCPVIVTSRVRLTGLTGAHWIHVDVFDTASSTELLAKTIGPERIRAEQREVVELVNLCGGLPLALRIAGARLASRPHWRIEGLVRRLADQASRLDEFAHRGLELRSGIGLTYRSLSGQAKRLFRLFALSQAPDFPSWTAAALLDTDLFGAEDVLARLTEAQLLDTVEYPGERVRYRFHELVRIYALELLNETETKAERHAALTRLLGAWLALAEKAHRAEYGGDYTILHGDAPRWQLCPNADIDPIVNPTEWWESERRALVVAVRQAAEADLPELSWDLALTSVSLFEVKGYFDDWRETAQVACDASRLAGNRTGEAAMLYSLGTLHMLQKRLAEAEDCFAASLAIFETEQNTHGIALVLRNSASTDRMRGNFATMLTKYEEARTKMAEVGDAVGEATILRSVAKYLIDEGDTELARPMLEEALTICQRTRHLRGEAQVLNRCAELHLATGQVALARQALHKVLRITRDIGDRIGEAHAVLGLGLVRRREGRLENAETTLVHALSLATQVGERLVEGQARYALGGIELARDNNAAAAGYLDAARQVFAELGAVLWLAKTLIVLSEVHEADGQLTRAAEELEEAAGVLVAMTSKEASRLLEQIAKSRSAMRTGGSAERPTDPDL